MLKKCLSVCLSAALLVVTLYAGSGLAESAGEPDARYFFITGQQDGKTHKHMFQNGIRELEQTIDSTEGVLAAPIEQYPCVSP